MTGISQMLVMLSLDIAAKRENRYSLWSYARAQAQADLPLTAPQTDPDWIVTLPPYRYVIVPPVLA